MLSFLKKILGFTGFALVFYALLIPVWKDCLPGRLSPNIIYKLGAYGHLNSRLKEYKEWQYSDSLDVLFLGSSHAYRGFDTRLFNQYGIRSFNLGSSSQSPLQTYVLLQRYLDKVRPKLIVYEVFPTTFDSDGVESSLDLVSNDKNDIYSYLMGFRINNMKTWNTLFYASYRDFFGLNKDYDEPVVKRNDIYVKGGFVEKKLKYYTPNTLPPERIRFHPKQLDQFEDIVSMIKSRGIELILVYAPIPEVNFSRYDNNTYFDSCMKTYSYYYNFNTMLDLNDSVHFYDKHHLNQSGVEVFNHSLIEVLNKKHGVKLNVGG